MSDLDVEEILSEAMLLAKNGVRGQHSNSKVVRLCSEIRRLAAANAKLTQERDEAYERAAKVIDGFVDADIDDFTCSEMAILVRALKSKPEGNK